MISCLPTEVKPYGLEIVDHHQSPNLFSRSVFLCFYVFFWGVNLSLIDWGGEGYLYMCCVGTGSVLFS